jgi:hypothetical protein
MNINLLGQVIDVKENYFIFHLTDEEICEKFKKYNDLIISQLLSDYNCDIYKTKCNNPITNSGSNYNNKYELKIKYEIKDLFKLNILDILSDNINVNDSLIGKITTFKLYVKKYKFLDKDSNKFILGYHLSLSSN